MEAWAAPLFTPALRVTSGVAGLGLYARSPIEPGAPLVRVPAAIAVTAESALRVPSVAALVSRETEAHVTLAVWLMHARRDNGTHGAYARALAEEADIDCTLLWSSDELEVLQTSRAAPKARALREWAAIEWEQMRAQPAAAHDTYANFLWSLCAVWSRSFQMRCASPDCDGAAGTSGSVWRVLAPGACLLNHAAENPAAELQVYRSASSLPGHCPTRPLEPAMHWDPLASHCTFPLYFLGMGSPNPLDPAAACWSQRSILPTVGTNRRCMRVGRGQSSGIPHGIPQLMSSPMARQPALHRRLCAQRWPPRVLPWPASRLALWRVRQLSMLPPARKKRWCCAHAEGLRPTRR